MRKSLLLMGMLLFGGLSLHAQVEKFQPVIAQRHTREIGFTAGALSNLWSGGYSVFYNKRLQGDERFLRMRGSGSLVYMPKHGIANSGFVGNLGLSLGVERRKQLAEKLYLHQGFESGLGFSYNRAGDVNSNWGARLSAGYVLGMQYHINSRFGIKAEVIPQIGYATTYSSSSSLYRHSLDFSTPVSFGAFFKF